MMATSWISAATWRYMKKSISRAAMKQKRCRLNSENKIKKISAKLIESNSRSLETLNKEKNVCQKSILKKLTIQEQAS